MVFSETRQIADNLPDMTLGVDLPLMVPLPVRSSCELLPESGASAPSELEMAKYALVVV